MKLETIGDFAVAPWRNGRHVNVGKWSFVDGAHNASPSAEDARLWELSPLNSSLRGEVRDVYHYGTHMGSFRMTRNNTWEFVPVSRGWGSASDQQGMNKMLARYGWRYVRKGGARYERVA